MGLLTLGGNVYLLFECARKVADVCCDEYYYQIKDV